MVQTHVLQRYIAKAEAELRDNILPFWMRHAVDRERGGFYGEISNELVIDKNAVKGSLLTARILWTYAVAYRRYQAAAHLHMAHYAYAALNELFWDESYGGLYWSVTAAGEPLQVRKQIYGHAFGIYALAEYYAATAEQAALERALALFRMIEQHSYDAEHGGYFEAYTREWAPAEDMRLSDVDLNENKSQNTHLHVLEAYTNLFRVWPETEMREKLTEVLEVMVTHIVDPETYHMHLFFDEAWTPKSDHISYGHDIEASWLLVEAAEVLGDPALLARVKKLALHMAQAVYTEGLDPDGAVLYEANPQGFVDTNKEWWPQAEAAVGFLSAYQLSREARFLEACLASWNFIEAHLVDRDHGEWFRYVTRDHKTGTDAAKVSFWKCPYHNSRACMELADRLSALSASNLELA